MNRPGRPAGKQPRSLGVRLETDPEPDLGATRDFMAQRLEETAAWLRNQLVEAPTSIKVTPDGKVSVMWNFDVDHTNPREGWPPRVQSLIEGLGENGAWTVHRYGFRQTPHKLHANNIYVENAMLVINPRVLAGILGEESSDA